VTNPLAWPHLSATPPFAHGDPPFDASSSEGASSETKAEESLISQTGLLRMNTFMAYGEDDLSHTTPPSLIRYRYHYRYLID
jgi:hypothetical protein